MIASYHLTLKATQGLSVFYSDVAFNIFLFIDLIVITSNNHKC